jgi:hypothetical protein
MQFDSNSAGAKPVRECDPLPSRRLGYTMKNGQFAYRPWHHSKAKRTIVVGFASFGLGALVACLTMILNHI